MSRREQFVDYCIRQLGRPVFWGAKGDYVVDGDGVKILLPKDFAFDCSGVMGCGLLEANSLDYRATWNAQRYFSELPPTKHPEIGDPGFYGKTDDDVIHMVVYVGMGHIVSADGASSTQLRRWDPAKRKPTDDERAAAVQRDILDGLLDARTVRLWHLPHKRSVPFRGWRTAAMLDDPTAAPR